MRKLSQISIGRFSLAKVLAGLNIFLALTYVGLIAIVMSYAAMHVAFAENVRNDEAEVAALEATYLATISTITATNYAEAGYAKPVAKVFVKGSGATALNIR